jgi:cobaltochelatase CobN
MHLLVRETHSLDEDAAAVDLGQSPGDIVVLSFSDSDLGALAQAWQEMEGVRPRLRLANLARLKHPMSVDVYLDDVVSRARCVVLRLLGGLEYWRYGAEEISELCRRRGIALAVVPGDGRQDAALSGLSTLSADMLGRMDGLLAQGGPANMRRALTLAAHLGGLGADEGAAAEEVPLSGEHWFGGCESGPLAVIVFYRSYLLAGDMAPLTALAAALSARGMMVRGLFVASLKEPSGAAFVSGRLRAWRPAVVVSATGFSARGAEGSPLDAADVPVLQLVLSGSSEADWARASRGLAPADLAMQVVLPELDGRLSTAAISFKEAEAATEGLDFARNLHRAHPAGVAQAADRVVGWARLAGTPRAERRVLVVLSDYPNAGGQIGHAVGLDTFASAGAMLRMLQGEGYDTWDDEGLVAGLTTGALRVVLSAFAYRDLFAALPAAVREQVVAAWGPPDVAVSLRYVTLGRVMLAVEPGRGNKLDRKAGYHDPDVPPCHAYIGFHLWRLRVLDAHALVHLGAHGVLEWLPGKPVALSESCFPQALLGGTPVIYPFIVNNPGEAAASRRRLGAVTIGHLTPPLRRACLYGGAVELERLIDEYAAADGLDRRRAGLLRGDILRLATEQGLIAEAGVAVDAPEDEALARLDAYLCDVKDLQIRDGLHVFGQAPSPGARGMLLEAIAAACPTVEDAVLADGLDRSAACESGALLAALDGRFVQPGPAGAPTRGRADVLPTGRQLCGTDPRSMPTRTALRLAELAAADLLRRHRQDHGENPRALVVDLWGSASLRTGGEDLGLAFVLIGAKPVWDEGSNRVTGVEILPLAVLDRPRVDVTLRVSGLFRDAFETQIALFDSAIRALAARDEAVDWNPMAGAVGRAATARVFGQAPGAYGAGISDQLARGAWENADDLGVAYLAASQAAYGQDLDGAALPDAFARLVAAADGFVHQQDHREMDLLDGPTLAAHAGGFAAAAASLGGKPVIYHADTSRPETPRTGTMGEEIARVVRGRAANPLWIAGQMRHAYRGAAEIARPVEALSAFAATLPQRFDRQFDLLYDATLGDADVDAFLRRENPAARADMVARFDDARQRGLWRPQRNDFGDAA